MTDRSPIADMPEGGMRNMVVRAVNDAGQPVGHPLYSGSEASCFLWQKTNGGKIMTPEESEALTAPPPEE